MKRGQVIGTLVIAICAALAVWSLQRAATPHVHFKQARTASETCQVYGRLVKDSIRLDRAMTLATFTLVEKETGEQMKCLYDKPAEPVPANFASAIEVRAVGTYSPAQDAFVISQLYTKCPSKYNSQQYQEQKEPLLPAAPREPVPSGPAPRTGDGNSAPKLPAGP